MSPVSTNLQWLTPATFSYQKTDVEEGENVLSIWAK
jgi:hypothetical protein